MKFEGIENSQYGWVKCSCGLILRVLITQYRVECPCGKSAILGDLKREATDDCAET